MRRSQFQLRLLKLPCQVMAWQVRTPTSGFIFIYFGRCMTCFSYIHMTVDVYVYVVPGTGYHFFFFFFFHGMFSHSTERGTPGGTGACAVTTDLIMRIDVYVRTTTTTTPTISTQQMTPSNRHRVSLFFFFPWDVLPLHRERYSWRY